jgi:hypothetical protein
MAKNTLTPKPSDVPDPTLALDPLDVFIGTWSIEGSHIALPGSVLRGHTTFEWLEGKRFLIQRERIEHPDVPDSISIIGADDPATPLTQHYFDSRGVSRVYGMSLGDGIWKRWREAPGFSQRTTTTFSDDGRTIKEVIELSRDGVIWERDMEKTYTKIT